MTNPPRRARLNLQRHPRPDPEDEIEARQRGSFWRWVLVVALLHVLVILGAYVYYLFQPAPKPPEPFISLLPPGDVVKGSPGAQQAHKLGAHSQAAPAHHTAPPPPAPAQTAPPQPKPVKPPPPEKPKPVVKENAPALAPPKPVKPVKPKPAKPKVKVDLHEVERTDSTETPPKPARHHAKKPEKKPDDTQEETDSTPDNTGLSKQQIEEELGDKLAPAGSHNADKVGRSGAPDGRENRFQDFYNLIAQQMNEVWNVPQTAADTAKYPVVRIHVEKDGRVPPDRVSLISSSGIPEYDDSALAAARNLGYLREPLPDGCQSDITINCKPVR